MTIKSIIAIFAVTLALGGCVQSDQATAAQSFAGAVNGPENMASDANEMTITDDGRLVFKNR